MKALTEKVEAQPAPIRARDFLCLAEEGHKQEQDKIGIDLGLERSTFLWVIVAANVARSRNTDGGPSRSGSARMSGVFGQKLGRK